MKEARLERRLKELKREAGRTEALLKDAKAKRPSKGLARLYYEVGQRLIEKRENAGLTQVVLAKRLKVSRTTITNIEAGKQRPPIHQLYRIAKILGVHAWDLLPDVLIGE